VGIIDMDGAQAMRPPAKDSKDKEPTSLAA